MVYFSLLAKVTLMFSAADYFSVAVFALTIIASLSGKDMLSGLLSGLLGIALAMVGMAPIDAATRFTFGNYQLMSGFDITVFADRRVCRNGYHYGWLWPQGPV